MLDKSESSCKDSSEASSSSSESAFGRFLVTFRVVCDCFFGAAFGAVDFFGAVFAAAAFAFALGFYMIVQHFVTTTEITEKKRVITAAGEK